MIEVEQTLFTREEGGNCLAACIASIFELPLEAVPNLAVHWAADDPDGATEAWATFAADLGVEYCERPVDECDGWRPSGYWLANVAVGDLHHSVVMEGDRLVWDPHPDRDSGRLDLNLMEDVGWFVVRDPAQLATKLARLSPSIADTIRPYLRTTAVPRIHTPDR